MNKLNTPLDDDELTVLDKFLLNRLDDDVDTEGKDLGVVYISTLDGLLTAIVSGPDCDQMRQIKINNIVTAPSQLPYRLHSDEQ